MLNNIIFIVAVIFDRESWALYRLSYLWYTMAGALVTMSVGLIVTLITSEDVEKLNPMLVAPFVRKYLKTSRRDVTPKELHQFKVLLFFVKSHFIFYYFSQICILFN